MTTKLKSDRKQPESPDFTEAVNLLAVFSEGMSRLAEIEARTNSKLLQLIDENKSDYAELQEACTKAETALEMICRTHPEWFKTARSIKTPYGTMGFRTSTSLEIKNEEATVKLLRAELERSKAQRGADGTTEIFKGEEFIRNVEVPDQEALEKLDDSTLEKFMVKRIKKDSFSVKAATVDFGKAVTAAAEAEKN